VDVVAQRGEKQKRLTTKFLEKRPYDTDPEAEKRYAKELNDEAIEMQRHWAMLKDINAFQSPKSHKFNLVPTLRLIKDKNGRLSILVTDLTEGGKKELVDLKKASGYKFNSKTASLIRRTIKADLSLAEKNKIQLAYEPYPLDTWMLLTDKTTKKSKVVITDYGYKIIIINAPETELKRARDAVEHSLDTEVAS
jgi:hypothetical protein